jgi:transmembrane sensor
MAEEGQASRREAAARWYAELQDPGAGAGTWDAFRDWERDPVNAAAFREVEAALSTLDRTSLAARRGAPQRRRRPAGVWAGALAAVVFLSALGGIALLNQGGSPAPVAAPDVYVTEVGEQRLVRLADGSSAHLNTSTRIEVTYTGEGRRVQLAEGQALFEVAGGEVPFLVYASGSETRALGTAFEVYASPDGAEITLLEGEVSVVPAPSAAALRLAPGERLVIAGGAAQPAVQVDLDAALSWRSGILQFKDASLADAVAQLNRYSETKIVLGDPALAQERLSGSFRAGDQDMFVSALALYLPVEAERSGTTITIRPSGG